MPVYIKYEMGNDMRIISMASDVIKRLPMWNQM